jgi:hypothetical protein
MAILDLKPIKIAAQCIWWDTSFGSSSILVFVRHTKVIWTNVHNCHFNIILPSNPECPKWHSPSAFTSHLSIHAREQQEYRSRSATYASVHLRCFIWKNGSFEVEVKIDWAKQDWHIYLQYTHNTCFGCLLSQIATISQTHDDTSHFCSFNVNKILLPTNFFSQVWYLYNKINCSWSCETEYIDTE